MSPINASAAVSGADSAPVGTDVETRRDEANGPSALSIEERDERPVAEIASECLLLEGEDDSPVNPAEAGSRCKYML